jgi:hypothetical protein
VGVCVPSNSPGPFCPTIPLSLYTGINRATGAAAGGGGSQGVTSLFPRPSPDTRDRAAKRRAPSRKVRQLSGLQAVVTGSRGANRQHTAQRGRGCARRAKKRRSRKDTKSFTGRKRPSPSRTPPDRNVAATGPDRDYARGCGRCDDLLAAPANVPMHHHDGKSVRPALWLAAAKC